MAAAMSKDDFLNDWKKHPMRKPKVASLILHCSVGESGEALERVRKIIESISGMKTKETRAKRTFREFGIRKGEPIGAMVTIRDQQKIKDLIPRLFDVRDNKISKRAFDREGNFGFGIREHIDIPGTKYDPNLGVTGLDVLIRLERPGYRVKRRFRSPKKIPVKHRISREEAIVFAETELGLIVE
ncbi:MAG: 50S ribosomal protein L5 [Candidatus Heimdallarchaeota archaeon]|nr:50S ribosomal protein L5 [Candidatus Heimdallarchaeota archaeon]